MNQIKPHNLSCNLGAVTCWQIDRQHGTKRRFSKWSNWTWKLWDTAKSFS